MLLELGGLVPKEMLFSELVANVVSFLGASSEQATGCGVSIVVPSADSGLS
jgi:hypothetical protein